MNLPDNYSQAAFDSYYGNQDSEDAFERAMQEEYTDFLAKMADTKKCRELIFSHEWFDEQHTMFNKVAAVMAVGGSDADIGAQVRRVMEALIGKAIEHKVTERAQSYMTGGW